MVIRDHVLVPEIYTSSINSDKDKIIKFFGELFPVNADGVKGELKVWGNLRLRKSDLFVDRRSHFGGNLIPEIASKINLGTSDKPFNKLYIDEITRAVSPENESSTPNQGYIKFYNALQWNYDKTYWDAEIGNFQGKNEYELLVGYTMPIQDVALIMFRMGITKAKYDHLIQPTEWREWDFKGRPFIKIKWLDYHEDSISSRLHANQYYGIHVIPDETIYDQGLPVRQAIKHNKEKIDQIGIRPVVHKALPRYPKVGMYYYYQNSMPFPKSRGDNATWPTGQECGPGLYKIIHPGITLDDNGHINPNVVKKISDTYDGPTSSKDFVVRDGQIICIAKPKFDNNQQDINPYYIDNHGNHRQLTPWYYLKSSTHNRARWAKFQCNQRSRLWKLYGISRNKFISEEYIKIVRYESPYCDTLITKVIK